MKYASFFWFRLHPNAATMQFYDFFTMCQTNSRPIIFTFWMKSLKYNKYPFSKLFVDSDPVVRYFKIPGLVFQFSRNLNIRTNIRFSELNGIGYQVLKQLPQFNRKSKQSWELSHPYFSFGLLNDFM